MSSSKKIYFDKTNDTPKKSKILLEGLSYVNNPDFRSLKCGNLDFNSDEWDLSEFTSKKLHKRCVIWFAHINNESFRNTIKQYTWHLMGNTNSSIKFQSIPSKISSLLSSLLPFMKKNELGTLKRFDKRYFKKYLHFLKDSRNARNKPFCNKTLARKSVELQELAKVMIDFKWDEAPRETLEYEMSMNDYWEIKKAIQKVKNTDKAVPESVLNQIKKVLPDEPKYIFSQNNATVGFSFTDKPSEFPYPFFYKYGLFTNTKFLPRHYGLIEINLVKYLLILLYNTGLRISEVLSFKTNSAWQEESYFGTTYYLNKLSSKTENEPVYRRILINKETFDCIEEVKRLTEHLRQDTDFNTLFIRPYKGTKNLYSVGFCCFNYQECNDALKEFMQKHNITHINKDGKEEVYPLHAHQFRHTFAQKLVNDGVPIRVIKKHYSHVSIDMTAHYAKLKEETIEKDYVRSYLDAKTIYTSGDIGEDFKELVSRIRTVDNLDDIMSELSKRFGINPLPMGMCLMDFKKGHCSNTGAEGCYYVGCNDFVTNDSFLPDFQKQKDLIDKEIDRIKDNRFAKMNFQVNIKKRDKLNMIITALQNTKEYREA